MFPKIPPKIRYHLWIDPGMLPPFGFPQTPIRSLIPETIKPLSLVKIKIVRPNPRFQPQEALDLLQLGYRVFDKQVSVDDQQLIPAEHLEPPMNEIVIQRDGQGPVRLVDRAVRVQGELLEGFGDGGWDGGGCSGCVCSQLSVIGYRPGHGLADDQQEFYTGVHRFDPLRNLKN